MYSTSSVKKYKIVYITTLLTHDPPFTLTNLFRAHATADCKSTFRFSSLLSNSAKNIIFKSLVQRFAAGMIVACLVELPSTALLSMELFSASVKTTRQRLVTQQHFFLYKGQMSISTPPFIDKGSGKGDHGRITNLPASSSTGFGEAMRKLRRVRAVRSRAPGWTVPVVECRCCIGRSQPQSLLVQGQAVPRHHWRKVTTPRSASLQPKPPSIHPKTTQGDRTGLYKFRV